MTVSRDNYAEQNARLSGAAIQRARGSNAGIEEEPTVRFQRRCAHVNFSGARDNFFLSLIETINVVKMMKENKKMKKMKRRNVQSGVLYLTRVY